MAANDDYSNTSVPHFSADDVVIATLRAAISGGFFMDGLKSELTASKRKAPDGSLSDGSEEVGQTEASQSVPAMSNEALASVWREKAVNADWKEVVEKVSVCVAPAGELRDEVIA